MNRRATIALVIVAALVIGGRLAFNLLTTFPTDPPTPKYPRASLPQLPAPEQNAYLTFSAVAAQLPIGAGTYDHMVLDGSWRDLHGLKKNGLNLDFEKDQWAISQQLDEALKPAGAFVETCEPGEECDVLPAFRGVDLLINRALVLANRTEIKEAVSLALRLRLVTAQWASQARSMIALAAAMMSSKRAEQLVALLLSAESPAKDVLIADPNRCAKLPPIGEVGRIFKFEAATFYESTSAKKIPSSYRLLDLKESQEMIDTCTTLLIGSLHAECSPAGLDEQPNWLHNKQGRLLAGAMNVTMNQQASRLTADLQELERLTGDASRALGCQ
jgi:hypothetical protein